MLFSSTFCGSVEFIVMLGGKPLSTMEHYKVLQMSAHEQLAYSFGNDWLGGLLLSANIFGTQKHTTQGGSWLSKAPNHHQTKIENLAIA